MSPAPRQRKLILLVSVEAQGQAVGAALVVVAVVALVVVAVVGSKLQAKQVRLSSDARLSF